MYPNFEKFTLIKQIENTTSDSTGNNTVLAVSGQLLSVRAAAVKYADNKWKNRDELLTEYNQSIADFEAGAQWLISQAACASGALDKTVREGKCEHEFIQDKAGFFHCQKCKMTTI